MVETKEPRPKRLGNNPGTQATVVTTHHDVLHICAVQVLSHTHPLEVIHIRWILVMTYT